MDLFGPKDLFSQTSSHDELRPLAEQLRPKSFDDFVGQETIAGKKSSVLHALEKTGYLPNLILWGPPGTGKTTFAQLISQKVKAQFVACNAIDTGAKDLREIGVAASERKRVYHEKTLLFIDEIHRLNKSQQDVLLPFTERGDLTLIGATTENPSYELNSALLSRARVLVFEPLGKSHLESILDRAAKIKNVAIETIFTPELRENLVVAVAGDARKLLNIFETVLATYQSSSGTHDAPSFPLSPEGFRKLHIVERIRFDKKGSEHYDVISAFIKSVRGSDPDAAIYYLARMLEGGEDPVFIARRLVILASEDIGNADPRGLSLAVAGLQAVELVGMPEARIALAQVVTYLACAPKSNSSYNAINSAIDYVRQTGALSVPESLRSARGALAEQLGYGRDYLYSHDFPRGFAPQVFLPKEAKDQKFYEPTTHGFEKNIGEYLRWLRTGKNSQQS